jgi:hypothetical protein
MRGKLMVVRLIRTGARVKTPNGEGVTVGSMLTQHAHLVVVDHGRRGEGGVVETTAYPRQAVKEVEE